MDSLDDLKRQWQEMQVENRRLSELNATLMEKISQGKVQNLQDKLAGSYGKMRFVGLLLPFFAVLIVKDLNLPVWYGVIYALFGVLMSILFILFVNYVKQVELTSLPVTQAVSRAAKIRKMQAQLRIFAVVCATIVLAGFFGLLWYFGASIYVIAGGVVGLIIGLSIAVPRCMRQARAAQKLYEAVNEQSDSIH